MVGTCLFGRHYDRRRYLDLVQVSEAEEALPRSTEKAILRLQEARATRIGGEQRK